MNFTALLILIQLDEIVIGGFFKSLGEYEAFEHLSPIEGEDQAEKDQEILDVGLRIIES